MEIAKLTNFKKKFKQQRKLKYFSKTKITTGQKKPVVPIQAQFLSLETPDLLFCNFSLLLFIAPIKS